MKGEQGLQNKPFRYGGIFQNFDKTAEYFKSSPRCYACGDELTGRKPYVASYRRLRGKKAGSSYFRMLCRECAYAYGRGVIEKDGKTYKHMTDYKEDEK